MIKKKNKYSPVNCTLVDWVEHFATKKQVIDIEYMDDNGHEQKRTTIIKTWINKDEAEYLVAGPDQLEIRLDKIKRLGKIDPSKLNDSARQ